MATIRFKRGSGVPSTSALEQFEPAINMTSNELYIKGSDNTVSMINVGYHDQETLVSKLVEIESASQYNQFSTLKTNFMTASYVNSNVYKLTNMIIDTLDNQDNIDTSLSETSKYKFESTYISPQYTNLYTISGGGTAEHGVGNILRRQYTTPDGYVITSNQNVSTLAASPSQARMDNMFDGAISTSVNDYWLANGATIDGTTPALDFNFLSSGIDIYQLIVYPSAGANARWMNADVRVSSDGTNYTTKGSFSGSTKVSSASSFDTITIDSSTVKKMNFICTDAGLSTNSTKSYCINEIIMVPKTSKIITKSISLLSVPKKLMIVGEVTGSVEFSVSFDDGATWSETITKDSIYTVPSSVTQTSVRVRANLMDGAKIYGYGIAWA